MSCVYFVQCGEGGPIKIGFAKDVNRRMAGLTSPDRLNVLATLPGGRELERRLHRALHASRRWQEWFNPTREVLAVVLLAKRRGLEPIERWLDVKEQEVEVRPISFDASTDLLTDIRALIRIALRHMVDRHGKEAVAAVMERSDDQLEQYMATGANIPAATWFQLKAFDPGACVHVEARVGDVPAWMLGEPSGLPLLSAIGGHA